MAKILNKMGVSPQLEGYGFIKTAVLMVLNDESLINAITKELYPEIAKKHKTTARRAARSIRYAIETSFNNMHPVMIEEFFENWINFNKGKPTNSQFIATLVEMIKLNEED